MTRTHILSNASQPAVWMPRGSYLVRSRRSGLGQVSNISWWTALNDLFNPLEGPTELAQAWGQVFSPIPGTQSPIDIAQNAWDGTVSANQKKALVQQETQGLVQAGMDPASAATQASQDITGVLVSSGADPSQSSFPTVTNWLLIGGVVLGLAVLVDVVFGR